MTGLYRYAIFQSTLPRGERLSKLVRFNLKKFISIHAPARGATKERYDIIGKQFGISIHAPARGATRKTFWKTHRHRISIHAPARGATQGTSKDRSNDRNFNPRSREGSDDLRYRIPIPANGGVLFQSTLPRRERLVKSVSPHPSGEFQSTLPRRERRQEECLF